MPIKDLKNKCFGLLTVISRSSNNKHGCAMWLCECECGKEVVVHGAALRNGITESCGCYHKFIVTKHGMYGTPTYKSWDGMKQRCFNPNNSSFKFYGFRGITVCNRWIGDGGFINFMMDMGRRPEGKTIDRINNDLGYSPENCKWSDIKEQNNNKRNCNYIVHNGEKLTHAQWSIRLGGNKNMVEKRIKAGWEEKEAVTTFCNQKQRRQVV